MSADKKARSALARGNEVSDSSTIPKDPPGNKASRSGIDSQQAMSANASQAMLGINNNNGRATISSDWRAHARPVPTEAGMAVGPDSPLANVTRVTGAGPGAIYAPTVRRATNASLLSNSSYGDYDAYSSNLPISPTLLTDRGSNAALAASIMDPRAAGTSVTHTHNDRLLFNRLQNATAGPTSIGTHNGPNNTANAGYGTGAVTGGGALAALNAGPPVGPSGAQAGVHNPLAEMTNFQSPQAGSFQVATRAPSAYSVSEYSNVSAFGYYGFDAADEGADEHSPTVIQGGSQAGGLSLMDYAYCIPRGNGNFTPLIPADMLPGLRDIPATIRDTTHVQVLECPHGMAPNGRSYYMQSIELSVSRPLLFLLLDFILLSFGFSVGQSTVYCVLPSLEPCCICRLVYCMLMPSSRQSYIYTCLSQDRFRAPKIQFRWIASSFSLYPFPKPLLVFFRALADFLSTAESTRTYISGLD